MYEETEYGELQEDLTALLSGAVVDQIFKSGQPVISSDTLTILFKDGRWLEVTGNYHHAFEICQLHAEAAGEAQSPVVESVPDLTSALSALLENVRRIIRLGNAEALPVERRWEMVLKQVREHSSALEQAGMDPGRVTEYMPDTSYEEELDYAIRKLREIEEELSVAVDAVK